MAIVNRSNLLFSTTVFALICLNIVILFRKLNNHLKYFINKDTILKQGVEGYNSPPHTEIYLFLNFKLTLTNVCFVYRNFMRNTE